MGELINRFKTDSKFAINTQTQEEYDLLMQWCEKEGINWNRFENATSYNAWNECKQATTITAFFINRLGLVYSDVKSDLIRGSTVIPFSDFAKEIMPEYGNPEELSTATLPDPTVTAVLRQLIADKTKEIEIDGYRITFTKIEEKP